MWGDVLIKYVMPRFESLNPCFGGRCGGTQLIMNDNSVIIRVLILVLVEDVGGREFLRTLTVEQFSLNPCFGGRCGGTQSIKKLFTPTSKES